MDILYYHPFFNSEQWLSGLKKRLPEANIRQWVKGDNGKADYTLVWLPPNELLANRQGLKAIFVLGAGVDAIITQQKQNPSLFPENVLLVRLEDTGMGQQMVEYATAAVMRYFRRFDEYDIQQREKVWQHLKPHQRENFVVGVLGAGVLGGQIACSLAEQKFIVKCWSRTHKNYPNVTSYAGSEQLDDFLAGTQVLINILPNTPETHGILSMPLFRKLNKNAYLINVARGIHVVDEDVITALDQGQLAAATLDVFHVEPLPLSHPYWTHPRLTLTPHMAAITSPEEAMDYIVNNIKMIEAGQLPKGIVDVTRGY